MASFLSAMMSLMAGLGAGNAEPSAVRDGAFMCTFDERSVALSSAVTIAPYTVDGDSVDKVVDELTSRSKPFPARAYGQIGWFDYSWRSRVGVGADGNVSSVCVKVEYSVHYPSMSDPAMAKCFSKLAQNVESHELHHLEITQDVISETLSEVVGMSPAAAKKRLSRLDRDVNRVNAQFHRTPQGAVMGPAHFPAEGCGQSTASANPA